MTKQILRPLDYAGLLDETFKMYKNNFLLFAGITAVLAFPIYLISYTIGGIVGK